MDRYNAIHMMSAIKEEEERNYSELQPVLADCYRLPAFLSDVRYFLLLLCIVISLSYCRCTSGFVTVACQMYRMRSLKKSKLILKFTFYKILN